MAARSGRAHAHADRAHRAARAALEAAVRRLHPLALGSGALVALVYPIIEAPNKGWTSPLILASFGAAAALGAIFAWWELRSREPMLELGFFRKPAFSIASLAVATPTVRTQTTAVGNPDVDAIFQSWDRSDSPGCALGVIQNGRFVYTHGYGMANLDYGIKNSPTMAYYVGSLSKQFTAASVVLLAAEGRIGLDDPVRKYIPELRDYGAPLTVRHLLHHTSGIRDIYELMGLAGIRQSVRFVLGQRFPLVLVAHIPSIAKNPF